ncbi:MAG: hypothetical protein IJ575_08540 [Selenomonadaceae bacterium]|nr:hypothetical protein [Selenomonadaceae bacterium]
MTAIKNNFFVRHFKKILIGIIVIIALLFFIRWIIVGVITKLIITLAASMFPDFNLAEFVSSTIDQIKNFFSNLF